MDQNGSVERLKMVVRGSDINHDIAVNYWNPPKQFDFRFGTVANCKIAAISFSQAMKCLQTIKHAVSN